MSSEDIIDILGPHVDFLIFQQEEGDEGTKHYQGYCEFLKPLRFTQIHKICSPHHPHWEKRRGTRQQARDYSSKLATRVDGPWVYSLRPWDELGGTKSNQGKRNDLNQVVERIKEGATDTVLLDEFPSTTLRMISNIQKVRTIIKPQRTEDLVVCLFYGKPGTGKTKTFWDNAPEGWSVPVSKDLWFTGYQGEKSVLIDDFSGSSSGVGLSQLLQILDRYPVLLSAKFGHVWWCPNLIVITTNCHPCNWYDYSTRQDSYQALERRFKHVFLFKVLGEPEEEVDVHNFFNYQKVQGHFYKDQ